MGDKSVMRSLQGQLSPPLSIESIDQGPVIVHMLSVIQTIANLTFMSLIGEFQLQKDIQHVPTHGQTVTICIVSG